MKASSKNVQLCRAALVAASFLAFSNLAHAQGGIPGYPANVEVYDPREVGMLPRYCIHTMSFREKVPGGADPAQIRYWESVMGNTFNAMHHYCWGLMKTNRAMVLSRSRQSKIFYLNDTIGEFDYVIAHSPPDFVLLPEVFTRKGENLLRLGRAAPGMQALQQAISIKPDYWPPYAYISDYYLSIGDMKKAREPLQQGLAANPGEKALTRRLAEIDSGKARPKAAPSEDAPAEKAPAEKVPAEKAAAEKASAEKAPAKPAPAAKSKPGG